MKNICAGISGSDIVVAGIWFLLNCGLSDIERVAFCNV